MIPVVLHHGFARVMDFEIGPIRTTYFAGIDRAISALGHPLILPRVHPTAGIAHRARQLKDTILSQLQSMGIADSKVIIIAHSMGGLDARYMIAHLGMSDRVAALATVATPHRGTTYADWAVRNVGQRMGGLRVMRLIGWDVQGAADLTLDAMRRFNDQTPDAPGVKYFSISGSRPWQRVPPWAYFSHKLIYDAEGENDGIVSVVSAKWGQHLETWPADHWHTMNKRFIVEINDPTGDIIPFYMRLLQRVVSECATA